jgi:hypothetical protein
MTRYTMHVLMAGLWLAAVATRGAADEPAPALPVMSAPATSAVPKAAQSGPASQAPRPPGTPDRMDLDATSIRGNQELPKVLYIVPWKEPGLAEPAGRPLNSLVDEALAPVDREVFRRQVSYFDQLYPPSGASSGDGAQAH